MGSRSALIRRGYNELSAQAKPGANRARERRIRRDGGCNAARKRSREAERPIAERSQEWGRVCHARAEERREAGLRCKDDEARAKLHEWGQPRRCGQRT